jgi:GT2 family glycosyltransferase
MTREQDARSDACTPTNRTADMPTSRNASRPPGWTAIVINYNGADYLPACLHALEQTVAPPVDIIVVDNASTDDSLQELHGYPRVNVLAQPRNLGFAGGANVGLAAVETEYAVILNPDVEVEPGFGTALLEAFDRHPRLGAAGALLLYPDRQTIQHAGGALNRADMTTRHLGYGETDRERYNHERDIDFVTGGAIGLRLSAVRAIGGFDERFAPVYYEDVDLCLRLRAAGWGVRYFPSLVAIHHEGVTLERSAAYHHLIHANRLRFALKHLSSAEWREQFLPNEIARLRHALATVSGADWPARSGASSVEAVARWPREAGNWELPTPITSDALEAVRAARAALGAGLQRPETPRPSLLGRLRNMLSNPPPEWHTYVDQSIAHVNETLLAALDAQDRVNREQVAIVLTLALDLLDAARVQRGMGDEEGGTGDERGGEL